jgi:two-component system response regulator YesN
MRIIITLIQQLETELLSYPTISKEIEKIETVNEAIEYIQKKVDDIILYQKEEDSSHQKQVVDRAKQFIKDNYSSETMTLSTVAEAVYVSPIYLSILFSKQENINFMDFVVQTRMEKAKQLLRKRELKIYEVAEQTGYSNPHYFSYCFKKYSGLSPSEFRQR